MRKTQIFMIFFMFLLSTPLCYANRFEMDTKFQMIINKNSQVPLQTDLRTLINLGWSNYNFTLGNEQLIWGVGQTGTLSLSPTSPLIPFIQYRIVLPMIEYKRFLSPLEREENRWLFGHRLEGKFSSLEIGIWELMLCSDEVFSGYFLPIPLLPLYATQHLSYKMFDLVYEYNSNAMFGMDFKYLLSDFGEVYGELVIDDFPQKSEYDNPRKAGGLIGIKYDLSDQADLWIEYVRINNFVYTHKNPSNRYLYLNKPFGHWLGMDGDLYAIGLNQIVSEDTRLYWQIHSIRKGEGNYTDNWEWDYGREYEFLTGIVEKSYQLKIKAEHDLFENLQLIISAGIGHSTNADHKENMSNDYSEFEIGLKAQFDLLHK